MATRLQDAKIRVTLETDDARKQIDDIGKRQTEVEGRERQAEEAAKNRARVEEDRRRDVAAQRPASTLERVRQAVDIGMASARLATEVVEPALVGLVKGLIQRMDFLPASFKEAVTKEAMDEVNKATAKISDLASRVEALIPAIEATKSITAAQLIAGGQPVAGDMIDLFSGLYSIQTKRANLQKAVERAQLQTISERMPGMVAELAKRGLSQ